MTDSQNPGSKPVAFDVDRGRLSYHAPVQAASLPVMMPARNRASLAAVIEAADKATTRWSITSLDGGVGRSTVAAALASLLASGTADVLVVDGSPSPWPATLTQLDVPACPVSLALTHVRPWPEWIPRSAAGMHVLAGSAAGYPTITAWDLQRIPNLPGATSFSHVLVDWPSGITPPVSLGETILVARGDTPSLERVVQLLNAGILDPAKTTLVVNHGTTVAGIDRRARSLRTTLEGRVSHVAQLHHDKALGATPFHPTRLAAATATALTEILTKGIHR